MILDDLYAIEWDSAENGGSDRDKSNVVSGKLKKSPRKVIITAFRNTFLTEPMWQSSSNRIREHWKISKSQHYQIDQPKEIEVPSV